MSMGSFALSQQPIAQALDTDGPRKGKPPPKRTLQALSDATLIPEPR